MTQGLSVFDITVGAAEEKRYLITERERERVREEQMKSNSTLLMKKDAF